MHTIAIVDREACRINTMREVVKRHFFGVAFEVFESVEGALNWLDANVDRVVLVSIEQKLVDAADGSNSERCIKDLLTAGDSKRSIIAHGKPLAVNERVGSIVSGIDIDDDFDELEWLADVKRSLFLCENREVAERSIRGDRDEDALCKGHAASRPNTDESAKFIAAAPEFDDEEIIELELADPPFPFVPLIVGGFLATGIVFAALIQWGISDWPFARRTPSELAAVQKARLLEIDEASVGGIPRNVFAMQQFIARTPMTQSVPLDIQCYGQLEPVKEVSRAPFETDAYQKLPIDQKLEQRFRGDLFDGDPVAFETVIEMVSSHVSIPIEFNYVDLHAEGIQKIRRIRINTADKTIRETLCESLMENNPLPVESASDERLVNVYEISANQKSIIITTRLDATKRGTLPTVFQRN